VRVVPQVDRANDAVFALEVDDAGLAAGRYRRAEFNLLVVTVGKVHHDPREVHTVPPHLEPNALERALGARHGNRIVVRAVAHVALTEPFPCACNKLPTRRTMICTSTNLRVIDASFCSSLMCARSVVVRTGLLLDCQTAWNRAAFNQNSGKFAVLGEIFNPDGLKVVRRREAKHGSIEEQFGLEAGDIRLRLAEPVLLALEGKIRHG